MDCVFCGLMVSCEARWVAQEMDAVAFLPLPDGELAPGHTLVIPRNHCVGVLDARPADLVAAISLVQRVANGNRPGLRPSHVGETFLNS